MSFGHDHLRTRKYNNLVAEDDEDSKVDLKVFIPTPTNSGHTHQVNAESSLMENGQPSEGESTDGEVIYSKAEDKVHLISPKEEGIDQDGVVREYEVALQHIGFGLFHIILVICNGLALTSDAVEVLSISFVLPVIGRADELRLEAWQTGLLSSAIFIGMLFGSYFWGGLADMMGRKKTLVFSLATSGVFGLVSAFSPNYTVFILLRFFSGFGVGGSLPVLFPYISEFICNKYRGPYLGLQSIFWMVGRFLCGALAWAIIPQTSIDFSMGLFRFHSWRLFIAISAVPSLLGVLLYWFLPESPRYLLEVGKEKAALEVLRNVHKLNHWRDRTAEYPVKSIQLGSDVKGAGKDSSKFEKIMQIFKRTAEMFNRKYLLRSLLFLVIYFTLSFGSYGVTLWYPTFVNELNIKKDAEIFRDFCSEEVSGINSSVIPTYCGCSDAAINNSVISDLVLDNWNISNTNFTSVTFQRVNFTHTSFKNADFLSSSFIDCSFIDSGFFNIGFEAFTVTNLKLVNSRICNTTVTNLTSNDVFVQNSTLNGNHLNTTINETLFLDLLALSANRSACGEDGLTSMCPVKVDDFRVYRDSFFISASALPGNLASMVAVYFLIRKYWLSFSLLVSTVSVFLLYVVHDETVVVIMLCLFSALSTPAWNDSTLIVAEVYPTHLRTTAAGIHLVAARIGAIIGTNIFGLFVYVNPSIPIFMVVAMLIIGALAALPLPKTTRKTLLK